MGVSRRVALGLAMLVVAAVVVAPERAGAAVGDPAFAGYLADDPAGSGYEDLGPAGPEGSLSGVNSIAVSSDGASIYTTGNADGDIGILTRYASGAGGNDSVIGSAGDDRLYGQNGHDRLSGGSGRDRQTQ